MKYTITTLLCAICICAGAVESAFAARLLIDAPTVTLSERQPIVVTVKLDSESDTLGGVSGNLSFPSDLFTVDSFITESSIVSPWVSQPKVSPDRYLDNRTHIIFEGIFPGGYSGVRSPYYQGVEPGVLFSVVLIPKQKGAGLFVVDDVALYAFSPNAELLPASSVTRRVIVPDAQGKGISPYESTLQVLSKTLQVQITRDELVARNAWYLLVNDREQISTIQKIEVAETDEPNILEVRESVWRGVSSPHVLTYQNRSKYVHVKVIYSNKTYSLITLPPVENSQSISFASRILVSIVVLSVLLYLHGKNFYYFFRKKSK